MELKEQMVEPVVDESAESSASEVINAENASLSIGQTVSLALKDTAIMFISFYGILVLVCCYFYALIIPPLRRPIKRGMGKLGDIIGDKYDDLIVVLTYEGSTSWKKILSISIIEIMNIFCYLYLVSAYCGLGLIMQLYGIIIFPLCNTAASTVSYLYNASGHLFNKITRCIAFDEASSVIKKIVSILIQLILHFYDIALLLDIALLSYICHIFIFWHPRLKSINKRAIGRLFSRLFKHIKAMAILCIGRQPDDIQIEADEDGENMLHYRKNGELDMRYTSSKEFVANL